MSACIVFSQSLLVALGIFFSKGEKCSQWRCFEKAEDECYSDLHLLVGTKHEEILITYVSPPENNLGKGKTSAGSRVEGIV